MISAYAVGMTRPVPDRVTVVPVQAVFDRIRARALEALVLTFALASLVEASLAHGIERRAVVAVLALAWSLPFLARGRHPFWAPIAACAALVALAFAAGLSTNNLTMPFVAAVMASVSFGLISDRRQSVAGWSAVVAAAAVVDYQTTAAFSDFFWTTLILTLAWFFGVALGTRTEQARELRAARGGRRARPGARGRARDRRGAVTDRAGAARRRCALRLGDGRSGVRRPPSAQGGPGARARGARLGRADRPAGADRDETYVGRHADGRRPACGTRARSPGCSTSTG